MTMKQHCQVNFPATANDRKCFDWNQKSQAKSELKNDKVFEKHFGSVAAAIEPLRKS
ncbi:MAG: hypothetical protein QOH41_931 [Blastocatellia bacterium]|jgi:hypothetical protein|nr:hypothetical protein [Blastocatellia bacterium]